MLPLILLAIAIPAVILIAVLYGRELVRAGRQTSTPLPQWEARFDADRGVVVLSPITYPIPF